MEIEKARTARRTAMAQVAQEFGGTLVSDDHKPMTGVWYRSTIEPWCMGKVTKIDGNMVEVTFTGGGVDRGTINEFADSWELI